MTDPRSDTEGVYLLANDAVLPWLRACAASLRHFNPDLRVVVIPFDNRTRAVRRLCDHYGFELWAGAKLEWLDDLARRSIGGAGPDKLMRKLAALWGPLERFLYLDVDTVVLMDLAPIFAALSKSPATFLFAHCDDFGGNLDEVYRPGPWRQEFLATHGSHAGNVGMWAAPRGLFSAERVGELAEAARPFSDEFVWTEQSFLNFCLDTTGTSTRNLHDFIDAQLVWAGVSKLVESGGSIRDPSGRPIGLVHWAGYRLNAGLPYRSLWTYWADLAPASPLRARSPLRPFIDRLASSRR